MAGCRFTEWAHRLAMPTVSSSASAAGDHHHQSFHQIFHSHLFLHRSRSNIGFPFNPYHFVNTGKPASMASSDAGQPYYCHECAREVRPAVPGELICPNCGGDFLEEWPGDAAAAYQASTLISPGFGQLLEDMSSFLTHMHSVQTAEGGGGGAAGFGAEPGSINPILALRDRIQNLLSMHNRDFPHEHGSGVLPYRVPGSIGDYFIGPGFEQLLQQLEENDPNRHGAPPASKSAVEGLPTVFISEEHLGMDVAHCAVCKDDFELCTAVKQMPCKHLYHPDCILPWLSRHNSCPLCRYELPTDDADYEQGCAHSFGTVSFSDRTGAGGTSQDAGEREAAGFSMQGISRHFLSGRQTRDSHIARQQPEYRASPSQDNNVSGREGPQGTGRRFSISFPWFRGFTTTFLSPVNAQAGSGGQASSAETVSSRPGGSANEAVAEHTMDKNDDPDDGDVAGA